MAPPRKGDASGAGPSQPVSAVRPPTSRQSATLRATLLLPPLPPCRRSLPLICEPRLALQAYEVNARVSCKATFDQQYRESSWAAAGLACRRPAKPRHHPAAAALAACAVLPSLTSAVCFRPPADAADVIERKQDGKTGKWRYYVHYLECEALCCATAAAASLLCRCLLSLPRLVRRPCC